ncbi:MAG: glycosyltransferase family 39 protein [Gemmatimonadales bacterium]|nr:glycosyltransferase family 39 protein [Gemmatimonadales bacterium]
MPLLALLLLARIALPLLLLHPAWEWHRDELLYAAMGDHLSWFGMQFPPLVPALTRLGVAAFGDAVWAVRVPAALAGGLLTGIVLWLVRRLGGGAFAIGMAWLAMLAAPVFVRPSVLFHPVILDQCWATLAVAALAVAAREQEPRWWLVAGLALGLGALTKFSVAFHGAALLLPALAVPRLRRQLETRWPWLAAGLALVLAVPSLAGQVANDWPFLRSMAALRAAQLARVSPSAFLGGQLVLLASGIVAAAFGARAAVRGDVGARVAGLFALALVGLMLLLGGKDYYAAPAWPALIAVGAVAWERAAADAVAARRLLLRLALPTLVAACALVPLPLGIPCLAPDAMARYTAALGIGTNTNRGVALALPQDYADMLGWRAEAESVAAVLRALPADERGRVTLVGSNYGKAGALALHRHRLGLPYPISIHGDFHAWGPGPQDGDITLLVDEPDAAPALRVTWREVQEVGRLTDARRVPEEQDVRLLLARGIRRPIGALWRDTPARWD